MPSDHTPDRVYVWAWLPNDTEPVVAGVLHMVGDAVVFRYAQSYQERERAVPLYLPELPLGNEVIRPLEGLTMASCIADCGPDRWGERVILRRLLGRGADDVDALSPLTYLLQSGSDRFGALDFQASPSEWTPRVSHAPLEELMEAADRVDRGESFSEDLALALFAGSSLGGMRPKVALNGGRARIGKFSSHTDPYSVVKAEGVAMNLARRVGLDVADTQVIECLGRDVLLVDRFDRTEVPGQRRMAVSVLTLFGLDPFMARYASYYELADIIRERFTHPDRTLHELFSRIVFNICVGNTDDHARNHAAFWDGTTGQLTLTPAYDICPQMRSGGEASQAMAIGPAPGQNLSRLANCVQTAETYHLTTAEARDLIDRQIDVIQTEWDEAAAEVGLLESDKHFLWNRMLLNPYCLEDYY